MAPRADGRPGGGHVKTSQIVSKPPQKGVAPTCSVPLNPPVSEGGSAMNNVLSILDSAATALRVNPDVQVIEELAEHLNAAFDSSLASGEVNAFQSSCRQHPSHAVFLEDPYTRRAYEKPRGYAGDARMLDYIYRPQAIDVSRIGQIVHRATIGLPNARSILYRARLLADAIDDAAAQSASPRILSVACGHMRELDHAKRSGACEIWALDQDQDSLLEAQRSYPQVSRFIRCPISHVLRDGLNARFDLIYSAGLFDYLSDRVAIALIRALHDSLEPGGTLIVGNFAPDSHGRGYMAGIMDWHLVYRSEDDLLRLVRQAAPQVGVDIHRDEPGNVVYAQMVRRD